MKRCNPYHDAAVLIAEGGINPDGRFITNLMCVAVEYYGGYEARRRFDAVMSPVKWADGAWAWNWQYMYEDPDEEMNIEELRTLHLLFAAAMFDTGDL